MNVGKTLTSIKTSDKNLLLPDLEKFKVSFFARIFCEHVAVVHQVLQKKK